MEGMAIFLLLFLISVIDLREFRIPDVLVANILLFTACADISAWDPVSLMYRMVSAALVLTLFLVVRTTVGHIGLGDVKLVTALAYAFGLAYFLAAFLVSATVCLLTYYVNARRLNWMANTRIPLAPYILVGCVIVSIARGVIAYE